MRAGVIQSCYLPWRGYFDFIASVDVFVIYDDVQYSTGSWRNRNRVKRESGLQWMTVPVAVHGKPRIDEVKIADSKKTWRDQHLELLTMSLGQAPYFREAIDLWRSVTESDHEFLSPLNVALLRNVCEFLGIRTPILYARDYELTGSGTHRLLQLLLKIGATSYLSGPSAKNYLDETQFGVQRIQLEFKSYDYAPYSQLFGEFVDGVTILDLIANLGPDACQHLRSRTPDTVAVS